MAFVIHLGRVLDQDEQPFTPAGLEIVADRLTTQGGAQIFAPMPDQIFHFDEVEDNFQRVLGP